MKGKGEVPTEDKAGGYQQHISQWLTSAQQLEEKLQLSKDTASLFPVSASITGTCLHADTAVAGRLLITKFTLERFCLLAFDFLVPRALDRC